ncbi:MAG: DUF5333 domain-containing protein [Pseudomonadota bacterium]
MSFGLLIAIQTRGARYLGAAMVLAALLCAPVAAKPSLRDVPQIDEGLFAVGLAHEIRKNCPEISARLFKAYGYLRGLYDEAQALGYSKAEIEAHVESDAEKDRMRARARATMEERGLTVNEEGYCALGRQEIAAKSATGSLLREDR